MVELKGYVDLEVGRTYYEVDGNKDGPRVVLVHGFSSPMFVWDFNFNFLVENGFYVLRYDLYGRGLSDRPKKVKYNEELFEKQLFDLIKSIDFINIDEKANPKSAIHEEKMHIVGLSMGGPIVLYFTMMHPDIIKSITLIDPAGLPNKEMKDPPAIIKIPIIGKLLYKMIAKNMLIEHALDQFYDPSRFSDYKNKFKEQFSRKGYLEALFSTLQNFDLQGFEEVYKKINELNIPVLLFWGENDPVIPYNTHINVDKLIDNLEFHSIPKCGHMPQYECPEMVNKFLLEFLSKTSE
ncbi:MAG: alpha/beta fold hydrolase [Promethearchaeota archaeon]